ncbi:DUF2235 domain-containing protein [Xanthomonas translucens pv. translucens]|nr:DUF2235 domain-containing protein [Xanthomonas translucens pv. translucens]QSQ46647.1 DUF2235 domain-containing protein [Xanthomonas translucens pv. translucens]
MAKKIIMPLGEDGLPLDDVSHYAAGQEHLRTYEQAAEDLYRFKVPTLFDPADRHSYLLVGLMDGTGNDVNADLLHATNVAKFRQNLEDLEKSGERRIHFEYIAGAGTQDDFLGKSLDGATGRTSLFRAEEMYKKLTRQSQEIFQADPNARIAYHLEGFSRGASQVPLLARMIDERGIPDPDGGIRGIDENGLPMYSRYHQAPGLTPISVGLYDPVPTGYMELFDRRLPPSVVSGFQISAEHERRGLFPVDQIMPHGLSDDGRFLNVTVAGAHSDIGGSYLRGGLGVRSFNLMTDYHNGVFGAPLLPPLHAPTDPRMNVIHRSEEGNALFAAAPKIDRASAQGQVHQLTADAARYAPPGQIVHAAAQAPEQVAPGLHAVLATARPVQPSAGLADPALTEGDTLAARLLRSGQVDFKPYAPSMLDRPGVRVAGALGVVGAAASLYEATQTSDKIEGLLRQVNPLAAQSEFTHYAGRNVGGWAGGATAAYALGSSGAGPMVLIAADAYFMSKAGEKAADLLDNRAIYHQTDRDGRHWSFDGRAWSREGRADTTNDGVNNPTPTPIVANYDKARELNYQATNAAAALALKDAPQPDDPYRLPANDRDRPSLSPANWMRDAADGPIEDLQRGTDGVYGADSPIEHLQRGADGVDRIAAITSTEDIQQALHEVRAHQRATPSAPALPTLASTASGSTATSDSNGATSGASPQLVLDVQAQTQAAIAAQQRQEREQQERQAQEQQQAQVREHAQLAQLEQARQADALRALQVQASEEHQRSLMQREWCLCYIPPEKSLPTWTAMQC